jgi:hypothetical protein
MMNAKVSVSEPAPDTVRDARPSTIDTLYVLPRHLGVMSLADHCRAAALQFLHESHDWGKLELVLWLTGPYDLLTGHAAAGLAGRGADDLARSPSLLTSAGVDVVTELMREAREEVLAQLRAIAAGHSIATFAFGAVARGHIVACEDRNGVQGFTPVGRASLSLAERVFSLLSVDYFQDPSAYDHLRVCGGCNVVSFGGELHACEPVPRAESGIYYRRQITDIPPPSREAA